MAFNQLDLQRMVNSAKGTYEDNTTAIRSLNHSQKIADDVNAIMEFKLMAAKRNDIAKYIMMNREGEDAATIASANIMTDEQIMEECHNRGPFLYTHYNDLFQRMMRDELDLDILFQLLNTLKDIEDGDIDQETGSVRVGKILYNMYVDSRNRQDAKKDASTSTSAATTSTTDSAATTSASAMSWKEYKSQKLANMF